jgi:hypothetical protein
MADYGNAYKNWFASYCIYRKNKKVTKESLTIHLNKHKALIKTLKYIHTTYPVGNLYDCQYSETSNPIILGSTALGTL